jgi:hypothetical protein
MSSSSNSYFVNVDGLFRDNAIWPNPTDFGINFTTFSGTGTFVQGDPINSDSFFQQASIDPDYQDNDLQFVNASVDQISRTSTTLLVCGLFNFQLDFTIKYNETILYFSTGYVYPSDSYLGTGGYKSFYSGRQMPLPFLASLKFDNDAIVPYSLNWIFYIRPSFVPEVYYNYSSKSSFQITESNNIYFIFDFTLRQFDFIIYKNNVETLLTSASSPTIDPRLTYQFGGNYGSICDCLVYISQDGDVGIVNGHSYGYHIFSSNYDIDRSQSNGNITIETDLADSAYVGLTTNPFRSISKFGPPLSTSIEGSLQDTMYNYESGKNLHFTNSTGTVVPCVSQVGFSNTVVNFSTGPYKVGFIINDPQSPNLGFNYVIPEPSPVTTQIVAQTWFTGSNKIFACISSIVGTNLAGSTGSSIFTVDPTTFSMTKVARMDSTGAGSVAYSEISGQIYLFNVNLYNYIDVYTFDTTSFALVLKASIQLPSTYFFTRTIFTVRDGSDVYVYAFPNGAGLNPSTYFRELRNTGFVLKYSTTLNTISIINSLELDLGQTLNYASLNLRSDTGKKYFYKAAFNKNLVLVYDITDPYNIFELPVITTNSNCKVFPFSQTLNGSTKYYLLTQTVGGANSSLLFDITDVFNNIILGTFYDLRVTNREFVNPSQICGPIDGEMFGFIYSGFSYLVPSKWKLPIFPQIISSSHYKQNLAKTVSIPGAVRCSTFNLDNQAYVAFISNVSLFIYNITSIRSSFMVSTISIALPSTIYDMQTITFNSSQYFLVCGLGFVFVFILSSNLLNIIPVGLFSSIPDAYSEARFFIQNNALYAIVCSYSSKVYRFEITSVLTLQTFASVQPGKIPAIAFLGLNPFTNILTLQLTTSNFATANDFSFFYDLTNSLTLTQILLGLPGAQPRSSSQTYNVSDGQLYYSLFANIGIGLLRVNPTLFENSSWLNTCAINISANLNGITRLFYTDKFYMLTNQYGGAGSLGDYLNIFDLSSVSFGIETFTKGISIGSTGVSTGAPASSLDIQLSQLNDRVTAVMLNSNGTFYLYDISNPEYAGQYQNPNVITSTYDLGVSFGAGTIFKLNNEGDVLFNNSLRTINTGTGPNGQLVNIGNIKISSDGLSVYACGGWKDKIQTFNPNSTTPSNQVFALQQYNGFVAKCDALNGNWTWIVPIYGDGDEFVEKLQFVQNKDKIVVVGYTSSDFCIVYQKQTAGSLTNPTVPQKSIVGSASITNSFILSLTSNGVAEWVTNSYSNEISRLVSFLDIGTQGNQIVVSGNSNASEIFTTDSSGNLVQTLYTKIDDLSQTSIVNFTFDLNGVYQKSTVFLYPSYTVVTCNDVKIFTDLNNVTICPTVNYNFSTTTSYYNKDGTLAHTDTGPANSKVGYIVNYKDDSRFTDSNANKYSIVELAQPPPYAFTGGFMVNYSMYILGTASDPILNQDFSIRNNVESPSGVYKIILNSTIDTAKIDRQLFSVNGLTGSDDYYNINISSSPLYKIIEYNIDAQPTPNNTITTVGITYLDTTQNYYITFTKAGNTINLPVQGVSQNAAGDYVLQLVDVNALRLSPTGPFYGPYIYLSVFNQNIYYNLDFNPTTILAPVFYTISLQSITIPNRPLRQPNKAASKLQKQPYIYLAIFCVDRNLTQDQEIVNIVYDNNPNRENTAIFQIPTVDVGNETNYVTLRTTTVPRIKFLPKFNTLRIQLLDRFGKVILFDNTPYKAQDSEYVGGVVPPELMNLSIQFTLTKL